MSSGTHSHAALFWLGFTTLSAILLSIAYLDRPLAELSSHLDPMIRVFCEHITVLGDSAWYLVPLGIATPPLYIFQQREQDPARAAGLRRLCWIALFLFVAIAFSGLMVDLLKILFGRARPVLLLRENNFSWHPLSFSAKLNSFPSGHANTVFALALALGFIWRHLLKPLLMVAALVALSRIAVGAHYLSDVIAGAAVAMVTTLWLRSFFARRCWIFERTKNESIMPKALAD